MNPLRPYYRAPVIGDPPDTVPSSSASHLGAATSARYASKARDVLADIDYKGYLNDSSPSITQSAKEFVDELIWKYTSVLMAQPFEVAKTILQAREQNEDATLGAADSDASKKQSLNRAGSAYDVRSSIDIKPTALSHGTDDAKQYHDSDSEGEEASYFTSHAPSTPTPSFNRSVSSRRVHSPAQPSQAAKKPTLPKHYLNIRRPDSVLDVIGQLWQQDGVWGVWKGSNATFLYTVLQSLLESWSRSFLSAVFNVPDLGVKDDIDRLIDIASPYPWASLFVAAAAAVTTGVLLSPLDLVRTR